MVLVKCEPPSSQYGTPLGAPISRYGTPNFNADGHNHDHSEVDFIVEFQFLNKSVLIDIFRFSYVIFFAFDDIMPNYL